MPCRFSTGKSVSRAGGRLGRMCGGAVLMLVALCAAAQPTKPCALVEPKYEAQGASVRFTIVIDCRPGVANARHFPLGREVLVGLTVYAGADGAGEDAALASRTVDAAPEIRAALGAAGRSQGVRVAGAPRWITLVDAETESYDFTARSVRIEAAGTRIAVQFEGAEKTIAGKSHLLFAAWPSSARKPCKRSDKYARSGCRRDGYVLGSAAGIASIAAYPGLETVGYRNGDVAERWIVERFR